MTTLKSINGPTPFTGYDSDDSGSQASSARSRGSTTRHDYTTFLSEWKSCVKNKQYQECQRICRERLSSGSFTRHRHNSFRSKVRNLFGVLLHVHLGKCDEARQQYQLSVSDDPNNASAHYNWAILCKNHYKDYRGAEHHYLRAISIKPKHAGYRNNYGLLLEHHLAKYEEAREQYLVAIKLDPKNGRAHNNMANLLKRRFGDFEGAAYHYEKSIEISPQNAIRHFNYGLLLRHNLNRPHDAAAQFEKALDLNPDYDQAHKEYRSYLLTQTDAPSARHCLRYAIWLLWGGRSQDARVMLNKTIELNPENVIAKALLDPGANPGIMISSNALCEEMETYERLMEDKDALILRLQREVLRLNGKKGKRRVRTADIGEQWDDFRSESLHEDHDDDDLHSISSRHKRLSNTSLGFDGTENILTGHRKLLNHAQSLIGGLREDLRDQTEVQQRLTLALEEISRCVTQCLELELMAGRERPHATMSEFGDNKSTAHSNVSYTGLSHMELARKFLLKSARTEAVPKREQEVAQWLTGEYLRTTNTPSAVSVSTFDFDDTGSIRPHGQKHRDIDAVSITGSLHGATRVESIKRFTSKSNVSRLLGGLDGWDFDVFEFTTECRRYALAVLTIEICERRSVFDDLDINPEFLVNYMLAVADEYFDNPYHNKTHACDVTANAHYFMLSNIFNHVSIVDQLACLVSAAVHDVGHPGHNNFYEVNLESDLAVRYNDQSVLEHYHVSKAWTILKKENCNFLASFTRAESKRFRKVVIDSVLATDMSSHAVHYKSLTQLIDEVFDATGAIPDTDTVEDLNMEGVTVDAFLLVPLAIHTADLSNPAKPIKYYDTWADAIMQEFWSQGDRERNQQLPISNLCDRDTMDKATCQVGFINFVIKPWFLAWCKLLGEDTTEILMQEIEHNFHIMEAELEKINEEKARLAQAEADTNLNDDAEVVGVGNDPDAYEDEPPPLPPEEPPAEELKPELGKQLSEPESDRRHHKSVTFDVGDPEVETRHFASSSVGDVDDYPQSPHVDNLSPGGSYGRSASMGGTMMDGPPRLSRYQSTPLRDRRNKAISIVAMSMNDIQVQLKNALVDDVRRNSLSSNQELNSLLLTDTPSDSSVGGKRRSLRGRISAQAPHIQTIQEVDERE